MPTKKSSLFRESRRSYRIGNGTSHFIDTPKWLRDFRCPPAPMRAENAFLAVGKCITSLVILGIGCACRQI